MRDIPEIWGREGYRAGPAIEPILYKGNSEKSVQGSSIVTDVKFRHLIPQ